MVMPSVLEAIVCKQSHPICSSESGRKGGRGWRVAQLWNWAIYGQTLGPPSFHPHLGRGHLVCEIQALFLAPVSWSSSVVHSCGNGERRPGSGTAGGAVTLIVSLAPELTKGHLLSV